HSIAKLPKSKQPRVWKELIQSALDKLASDNRGLAPFFPGPMDDFLVQKGDALVLPALTDIETQLRTATKLSDVRGLTGLAHFGRPSGVSAEDIRRLLELAARTVGDDTVTEKLLGVCAHFAVCARSESLANTVMDLCLRRVGNGDAKNDMDMF